MKLTVWGARGSIPVSGEQYVRYGGDTTCVELETEDGDLVILDAGSGLRALGNQVLSEGRKEVHFLLSHAHWDHLLGFPFFKPLYDRSARIALYGCLCAQSSIKEMISDTMTPPNFPVSLKDTHAKVIFHDYQLHENEVGSGFDFDPGVTEAVNELLSAGGRILERQDTLAVIQPPIQVTS